ncbi:hypothetical protein MPTK1_Vg00615 [Marchantia polymorpha subsp. ruderalis]|nr:hypothetical protein Mp_Vg00615 [Marchantia polymorpha subsp. ruderalis]
MKRIFQSLESHERMLVLQLIQLRTFHHEVATEKDKNVKLLANVQRSRSFLHTRVIACHLNPKTHVENYLHHSNCHIVVSLFHGGERLSSVYECSTAFVPYSTNPRWNEYLTIPILQANVPQVLSLNFALYSSRGDEKKDSTSCKLLGWTNLHISPTGYKGRMHVHMWQQEPNHSCGTILPTSTADSSGILIVDIDHMFHQFYEKKAPEPFSSSDDDYIKIHPSLKDVEILTKIINENCVLWTLNEHKKKRLWHFRNYIIQHPHALALFLSGVDWDKRSCRHEAHRLIKIWQPLSAFQALQLLGPQFGDPLVRDYATTRIMLLSYDEILLILIQLMQILQYDHPEQDSSLQHYLLNLASKNWSISHQMFWHIKL